MHPTTISADEAAHPRDRVQTLHRTSLAEPLSIDLVRPMTIRGRGTDPSLPNGHHVHTGHGTSSIDV
jgi:hypothetical protein